MSEVSSTLGTGQGNEDLEKKIDDLAGDANSDLDQLVGELSKGTKRSKDKADKFPEKGTGLRVFARMDDPRHVLNEMPQEVQLELAGIERASGVEARNARLNEILENYRNELPEEQQRIVLAAPNNLEAYNLLKQFHAQKQVP